jgi:hypothetical protein
MEGSRVGDPSASCLGAFSTKGTLCLSFLLVGWLRAEGGDDGSKALLLLLPSRPANVNGLRN